MKLLKIIIIQILIFKSLRQSIFNIDGPLANLSVLKTELKERFLQNEKSEKYLKSLKELITQIFGTEENLQNYKLDLSLDQDTNFKIIFLNNDDEENKENYIEGKIDENNENNLVLNFKNAIDESKLTLTNIDPEDEEEKVIIQDKYIKKYFSHLSQIKSEKEILQIIKTTIEETKNEEITTKIEEEPNTLKIAISETGEEKTEDESITIKIQEKSIHFLTKYFESNFSITIPTEIFIKSQITKLFKNVQSHFLKIKSFTNELTTEEHELSCNSISEIFENNNKFENFTFQKEDGDSENFVIKFVNDKGEVFLDNKEVSYVCDDQDNVVFVKVDVGKSGAIEQGFAEVSLYDLDVMVQAFWDDVFERIVRQFAPERESGVKVFDE